jgi:hypothetical protein
VLRLLLTSRVAVVVLCRLLVVVGVHQGKFQSLTL